VFRRRPPDDASAVAATAEPVDPGAARGSQPKGTPTPSRKEAEAARKARVRPPMSRREARQRQREQLRQQRTRTYDALKSGDETAFPPRDRGPVRAFLRDFVDSRRLFTEFFLPVMLVVLLLSLIPVRQLQLWTSAAWLAAMLMVIAEILWLSFRVRKEVARRFGPDAGRGNVLYALVRASQMRRFRLPPPRVRAGQPID
jgi:hypothetical protein